MYELSLSPLMTEFSGLKGCNNNILPCKSEFADGLLVNFESALRRNASTASERSSTLGDVVERHPTSSLPLLRVETSATYLGMNHILSRLLQPFFFLSSPRLSGKAAAKPQPRSIRMMPPCYSIF